MQNMFSHCKQLLQCCMPNPVKTAAELIAAVLQDIVVQRKLQSYLLQCSYKTQPFKTTADLIAAVL